MLNFSTYWHFSCFIGLLSQQEFVYFSITRRAAPLNLSADIMLHLHAGAKCLNQFKSGVRIWLLSLFIWARVQKLNWSERTRTGSVQKDKRWAEVNEITVGGVSVWYVSFSPLKEDLLLQDFLCLIHNLIYKYISIKSFVNLKFTWKGHCQALELWALSPPERFSLITLV